jgi:hypothetical protein
MKTIREIFIENYGEKEKAHDPFKWEEGFCIFAKGFFDGILWMNENDNKDDELLHGEKDE